MADAYVIDVTEDARADLRVYDAGVRKTIVADIWVQLEYEPTKETRNRKPLRDHPIASWELRCEKYRVFYDVDEATRQVTITAVGHKERQKLFVRGKEVQV